MCSLSQTYIHIWICTTHTPHTHTHTHMHWLNQKPWSRGLGSGFAKFRKWTQCSPDVSEALVDLKGGSYIWRGTGSRKCFKLLSPGRAFIYSHTHLLPAQGLSCAMVTVTFTTLKSEPHRVCYQVFIPWNAWPRLCFHASDSLTFGYASETNHTRTLPCEPVRRLLGRWSKIILHDLHGRYVRSHFMFLFWYYSLFLCPFSVVSCVLRGLIGNHVNNFYSFVASLQPL